MISMKLTVEGLMLQFLWSCCFCFSVNALSTTAPSATTFKTFTSDNMTTFKYFAYGSNLLEKRIHLNNPTARRAGSGVLKGYRLDFNFWSKRWGGYAATIVPDVNREVWGALWDIGVENMKDLDKQESVHSGVYRVIEVDVKTEGGNNVRCRSYELVNQPDPPKSDALPNLQPSKVYLDTIVNGAKETGLPSSYVKWLESLPHNGFDGPVLHDIALS